MKEKHSYSLEEWIIGFTLGTLFWILVVAGVFAALVFLAP